MDIDKIKQRILDLAIRGKLVSQDPNDEPASVLIEKIKAEKEKMIKEGKIKPSKDDSYIYKASDNCYYENIPNGWTLVKLKELISLKSGMDLMLSEINTNSVGIPYLTGASCFTNNGLLINRWTNAPKNISHKNDLLITVKGTIGELAFNNIGEVHIARQIMALTINEEIEQKFIFYFLLVNKERMIQKNASLIPGIKRDDILNLEIALPPKEEQKRIIAKIDELLYFVKKIKNELKAMCDLSIAVKRKILDFFFGENSSYKSYYEKKKIEDISKTISVSDFEIKIKYILPNGIIPVVSQSMNLIDGYINESEKILSNIPYIVFGDHTKVVKFINFPFVPGADGTKILKSIDGIEPKFLFYSSLYASNKIESRGYGRHYSKFKKVYIPVYPINLQQNIVTILDKVFSLIDSNIINKFYL